jgi:WD40 repeat protein
MIADCLLFVGILKYFLFRYRVFAMDTKDGQRDGWIGKQTDKNTTLRTQRPMAALGAGGTGETNYQCVQTLTGHTEAVICIVLIDEKRQVVTGSADDSIRVWDADTYELLFMLEGHASWAWSLAIIPGTDFLASGREDGSIIIFDLSTRTLSHSLTEGGHSDRVRCLLATRSSTLLVSGSNDKMIKVWDVVTRTCLRTLAGHTKCVYALTNVPGDLVVSGSGDRSVKVWNPINGECVRSIANAIGGRPVLCLAFVPGLHLLASGGYDGRITLLDVATGESKFAFSEEHTDWIRALVVLSGTSLLASCSDDSRVKVWNVTTGKCVQTLTGHECPVYGIAVDPSPDSLLTVSSDKTIKVWIDLKAASARRRYCVLACLSRLTAKLYAGEEYAAEEEEGEGEGGGGQDEEGRLQGVLALDSITSADVWRYILEFV